MNPSIMVKIKLQREHQIIWKRLLFADLPGVLGNSSTLRALSDMCCLLASEEGSKARLPWLRAKDVQSEAELVGNINSLIRTGAPAH